jgi:hypothetical protein
VEAYVSALSQLTFDQEPVRDASLDDLDPENLDAYLAKTGVSVCRVKVSVFSGCNSHPATFAPAGSNRSGDGGNEIAEAFDGKGRKAAPRAGRP